MNSRSTIRTLLRISLGACIVAAIGLILELAASLLFPPPNNFYIWPPDLNRLMTPRQDLLPGTSPRARFMINSYGVRGNEPSPDDDYRILLLGGSAAECLYLDQDEAWPQLLQTYLKREKPDLKIWVGNAGRSGQNCRDHAIHLEFLPFRLLDVDAVIISLNVNDLLLRLRQDEAYDPLYLKRPGAPEAQIDHAFLVVPDEYSIPYPPFYRRTGLWRALREARKRFGQDRPQDAEGRIIQTWRENRKRAGQWRDRLPDLEAALREQVSNLTQIILNAGRKDLRLIFTTQPALWKETLTPEEESRLWMGGVGEFKARAGQPYYTSAALAAGLDRYNELLKAVCAWRGVECFDLASRIPRTTECFYDDCHYTVEGSQRAARELCDYLRRTPPWTVPSGE